MYDVKTYFPITINSHVLTAHDSIYIKHNVREDYFTMIVGKDKEFCVEKSDKTDPAYYVFKLKYNYKVSDLITNAILEYINNYK